MGIGPLLLRVIWSFRSRRPPTRASQTVRPSVYPSALDLVCTTINRRDNGKTPYFAHRIGRAPLALANPEP